MTHKRIDFTIDLLTDVSVPESSRSLGGSASLGYVPGRALWGALAAAAFDGSLSEEEGLRLFRSGALRVFDAVPSVGGDRSCPTPRSWHRPKYGDGVLNLADLGGRAEAVGRQYVPLEAKWRSPSGREALVDRVYSLRTSVTASGSAGKGLLFGIEAIAAGTQLHARLEGEAEAVGSVAEHLLGQEVRLGRSKSAELGLARCGAAAESSAGPALAEGKAKRVAFLCCSRLALRDRVTGAPTFRPLPEDFGLPAGWRFEPASSFVRTSRYSPFNAKWMRPELERHVVEVGSVVVFVGGSEVDLQEVRARVRDGVGAWRAEGLGDVLVQPLWLTEARVDLPAPESRGRTVDRAAEPTDELFVWASAQNRDRIAAREAFGWAREKARGFKAFQLNPSQWGVIHALAREARNRPDRDNWLRERVENAVGTGVSSLSRGWGKARKGQKAGELLLELLRGREGDLSTRVELLAGQGMRASRKEDR